jgi:hypothetical protein
MTSLAGAVTYHLTAVWAYVPPGDSDPASGKGPEWGKAAPIGLLIWLLMGIALFLLIKSMNRNLRKVPKSFDTEEADGSGGPVGGDGVGVNDLSVRDAGEDAGGSDGDGVAGSGSADDGAVGDGVAGDGASDTPAAGGARRGS